MKRKNSGKLFFLNLLLVVFAAILPILLPAQVERAKDGNNLILAEDGKLHGTGLIYQDPETIAKWRKMDTTSYAKEPPSLPSSIINDIYLPPVGDQGPEGSCAAFATAYYTLTYTEGKARNWTDLKTNNLHQLSPAFLYNQARYVPDGGMSWADATEIFSTFGCSSLNLMPYEAGDYTTWPSEDAYKESMNYRIDPTSVVWVDTTEPGGIDALKDWLYRGNICFAGIFCYDNFGYISQYGQNYCLVDATSGGGGGHGTTIIGYDDSRVTNDGVGAFKCVNSWGTGWGDSGYYWISYQAVTDPKKKIFDGFFAHFNVITTEPSYGASFQINYSQFRDLSLRISNGSQTIFLWDLLSWKRASSRDQSISAPSVIWVNVSELSPSPKFSLMVTDGFNDSISGQITSFSVTELSTYQSVSSTNTPVSIVPLALGSSVPISNGGFESNFDDWTPGTDGAGTQPVISSEKFHSGTHSAYVFATGSEYGSSYILTSLFLPDNLQSLVFWYYPEYTGSAEHDRQSAYIVDNHSNFIWFLVDYSNEQIWKPAIIDLSHYAGQKINLSIYVRHEENSDGSISMYVDDVGLCSIYSAVAEIKAGSTITLSPDSLPNGFVATDYDQVIIASGGFPPFTFELTSGTLPAGLSLNTKIGKITGIPTSQGSSSFKIRATDIYGCYGEKDYTIEIKATPPVISNISKISGPFRLKIIGSNFHPGCVVKVNDIEVPHTSYKSSTKVIAEKGTALKNLLPKGVAVQITVTNTDDGGVSGPMTFVR